MVRHARLHLAALGLLLSANAHAEKSWVCLAQDKQYSYDWESTDKGEAKQMAKADCTKRSDEPAACYDHRCYSRKTETQTEVTVEAPKYKKGPLTHKDREALKKSLAKKYGSYYGYLPYRYAPYYGYGYGYRYGGYGYYGYGYPYGYYDYGY